MKLKKSDVIFIAIIIIFAILKLLLVSNLPILSEVTLGEDDALMIELANSITEGKWLGKFSTNTFLKGITFPVFLAVIYFLHIRYIFAVSVLYILSCIFFVWVISKIIKNKPVLLALYLALLFHPIMSCYLVVQRVYRNSIVISLALLLMGSYINLFLIRDETFKRKIPTIVAIAVLFPMFWYTREDSMWILPFAIFLSVLYVMLTKVDNIKQRFLNIGIVFVPVISLVMVTNIISLVNYKVYGVYEVRDDSYNEAVASLEKVKANVKIEKVTNTREKLDRIAQVSPAMQSIKQELDILMDAYAKMDTGESDTELLNGWFRFAFVGAVKESGYYETAKTADNFYKTLKNEIDTALENGSLERETEGKDYISILKETAKNTVEASKYILSFNDIQFHLEEGATAYIPGNIEVYKKFLKITRDRNLFMEETLDDEGRTLVDLEEQQEYINKNQYKENIIQALISIYKIISKVLIPLGVICYIVSTINFIIQLCKKKDDNVNKWVITSSILGAIFTLIVGIAYCTTTIFNSISALYLCATYPLLIAFSIISIYNCLCEINIKRIISKYRR